MVMPNIEGLKRIDIELRETTPDKADAFVGGKSYLTYWKVSKEVYNSLLEDAKKDPAIKKMFDENRVIIREE